MRARQCCLATGLSRTGCGVVSAKRTWLKASRAHSLSEPVYDVITLLSLSLPRAARLLPGRMSLRRAGFLLLRTLILPRLTRAAHC